MNTEIEKLERRWLENPLGLTFAPLAEAHRKSGDMGKALELLTVGIAQHPNYVPAHIVRARCHLDAGDKGEAEHAFQRVVELDSQNVIALQGLADLAESEGRVADAIRSLEALLEIDRNNEEAQGQLDRLNDSERLRPTEERLPDIMLLDADAGLPAPEAAEGLESLVPPDPEVAHGATGGTTVRDEVEVGSPSETEPAPLPEPEPDPEPEPEREIEAEPESAATPLEPALLVTETMADIFLRQGHRELALAVYSQLAQREPGNERVSSALAQLRTELSPPAPPPPPPPPPPEPALPQPARRYDAAATGGQPVSDYFAELLSAPRPNVSPAVHPPAFEPPAPAGAATETLASGLTFDEFFASPPTAGLGEKGGEAIQLPKSPENSAEALRADDPDDLEQFNAWLRGLKR